MSNGKPNTETVYVTKWGLSRGIRVYPPGLGEIHEDGYFQGGAAGFSCSDPAYCFVSRKNWTTSLMDAEAWVRKQAEKKWRSLQKQAKAMDAIANGVTPIGLITIKKWDGR